MSSETGKGNLLGRTMHNWTVLVTEVLGRLALLAIVEVHFGDEFNLLHGAFLLNAQEFFIELVQFLAIVGTLGAELIVLFKVAEKNLLLADAAYHFLRVKTIDAL